MITFGVIVSLLVCLFLLWPRHDGGGIYYNLALICTPCSIIGFGLIAFVWVGVWFVGGFV